MSKGKILLYAGTTEGRKLAEYLSCQDIRLHVCVTSDYAQSLLPEKAGLTVSCERMDEEKMCEWIKEYAPDSVIDATHPYAKEVTRNLKDACRRCEVPYLRLLREAGGEVRGICVDSVRDAVEFLQGTTGNILVTTGSKELQEYTALKDYKERLYARVLSVKASVDKCEELGITGRHLICMQGPFSEEFNLAMLREYDIAWMVTKESGTTGGFQEKQEAAQKAGAKLLVVGRPAEEEGYSLQELCRLLQKQFVLANVHKVSLVGIGPGGKAHLTPAAAEQITEADVLIGAKRMVEAVRREGQPVFVSYRPEEILTYLEEHPEEIRAAVVLSGDPGFYSGARKLLAQIEERQRKEPDLQMETQVLPGISALSYFFSKLQMPWENVHFLSLHGQEANLIGAVRTHERVAALAGRAEDIRRVCRELIEYGYGDLMMHIGSNLSYPEEQIRTGSVRELQDYEGEDLAVFVIEHPEGRNCVVTPGIPDDAFLRARVPMTKEEVRTVSLAKLRLRRDSVVYDIGAGTGSVSVEAALLANEGKVYAVEVNEEGVRLIEENCRKLQAGNVQIVSGEASQVLAELPAPDCVFIGGSKGKLREILLLTGKKNPCVRVVVNAITLETVGEVLSCIKELPTTEEEVLQLSVSKSKSVGDYHMMQGQNPIYIISFTMKEER